MRSTTRPVFLVGFPRSGTTYLQSLIATQPGLISFPETHFYSIATGHLQDVAELSDSDLTDAAERLARMLAMDHNEILARWSAKPEISNRAQCFLRLLDFLGQRQGDGKLQDYTCFLEKTPSHAMHLDRILSDHPGAKFIQITRHPVDAISSYAANLDMTNKDIGRLIEEYRQSYQSLKKFKKLHSASVLSLRYEDLSSNQSEVMAKVMSFIDIPFQPELLANFGEVAKKYIMSFEIWKDSNTQSSKRLRTALTLSKKEVGTVQLLLDPIMKDLNYEVRNSWFQLLYNLKNKRV